MARRVSMGTAQLSERPLTETSMQRRMAKPTAILAAVGTRKAELPAIIATAKNPRRVIPSRRTIPRNITPAPAQRLPRAGEARKRAEVLRPSEAAKVAGDQNHPARAVRTVGAAAVAGAVAAAGDEPGMAISELTVGVDEIS
jgi:hypothetical protein